MHRLNVFIDDDLDFGTAVVSRFSTIPRVLTNICCISVLATTIASGQENPRHLLSSEGISHVKTLAQNWSDEESNQFYNAPQGSRLMPYSWLIHLEQPDKQQKFLAPDHVRQLGYMPRSSSTDNPDGFPIGFVRDADYLDGTPGVGLTCAACHTRQINFEQTAYIIDGAPAYGDLQTLLTRLAEALNDTAEDDSKFERFAAALLTQNVTPELKAALRQSVREIAAERRGYNVRNLPIDEKHRFGLGRVDAFGAIFNEVSVTFLGVPDNHAVANAPVSYPCLWDAPQHDRVQWNGAAENRTSRLGVPLFGTSQVGALGRNAGEVLGVFGKASVNDQELLIPRRYASTVDTNQLMKIENSLKSLWSPLWPEEFGAIDLVRKNRGELIYRDNCMACHDLIKRNDPNREVVAKISDEGTDPAMLRNFLRSGKTGKLEGRTATLLSMDRLSATEPIGKILKHVVERVILKKILSSDWKNELSAGGSDVNSLNPGYQNTAVVKIGERKFEVPLETLINRAESLQLAGTKANLLRLAGDLMRAEGNPSNDNLAAAGSADEDSLHKFAASSLKLDHNDGDDSAVGEVADATASFGYKARPLNGVWATAPYLHNGSVATLAEILKHSTERKQIFHVGGIEFDPVNIGFVEDTSFTVFDTRIDGNLNIGHEHGTNLSAEQKLDLLEFLKSL